MRDFLVQIKDLILSSKKIVITTHVNPDGDALGSLLALTLGLKKLGEDKKIEAFCASSISNTFQFLPSLNEISQELNSRDLVIKVNTQNTNLDKVSYSLKDGFLELYITPISGCFKDNDISHFLGKPNIDLLIVLDCGELPRIGSLYEEEKDFLKTIPIINIDHHQGNTMFGQVNFVDTGAAATAQLLYQLLFFMDIDLDQSIATALLTGLITDTGNFQYSSTNPEAFLIASKLLSAGAEHQVIVEQMYRMKKYNTLKLWGGILTKLKNSADQKLIWSTVTQEELRQNDATIEEAESVLDDLMATTPKAEITLLFYEQPQEIRVSARSADNINAAKMAEVFGGGGHPRASGWRMPGLTLAQAESLVIAKITKMYQDKFLNCVAEKDNFQPAYTPEQIIDKISVMLENENKKE